MEGPPHMENKEIAPSSLYCWCCGTNDNKKGELVCLCKCADKLMHVYCLTEIANTVNIFNCLFCNAHYPLERRPKSLLKMLLNASDHFLMILFTIFIHYIIGLIVYLVLLNILGLLNIQFPFIIKFINQVIFFWFIYRTESKIVDSIKGIYEDYYQWYKSTYEWKLIRPSTVKNIEKHNI